MWSTSTTDFNNFQLVVDHEKKNYPEFEPTPYTFTKLEKGKKITVDSTSITPPSWLLLDHTIAVIWSMFNLTPSLHHLNIDDLKWAYEFLKEIRNKKGENPPDVKVCLKEIQDRLICLYAKLTSLKEEDFDEIAAAFGEKIIADSNPSYYPTSITTSKVESRLETGSLGGSLSPSKTALRTYFPSVTYRHSNKDLTKKNSFKSNKVAVNYSKKTFPLLEKDSNIFEEPETGDDEDVEQYILSLFDDDKKDDSLRKKPSVKSLIPTKRKNPTTLISEIISQQETTGDIKKTSKKVHCVAEMRSVKFQKSMKVQDTNGEEAAYSNLKAEIRRLTINPNVSRSEIMKFLKEWRSEQVDRLHNEIKRLNSIEEFMKNVDKDGVEPNLRLSTPPKLKELDATKNNYSLCRT